MESNQIKGNFVSTVIGESPIEYDVAFTSINSKGTLGDLNTQTLKYLGYDISNGLPPTINFSRGFSIIREKGKVPVIFVVTVNNSGDTAQTLRTNLVNALNYYSTELWSKRLWIPLMGTGAGGLTLFQSYKITYEAINRVTADLRKAHFIISVPDSEQGQEFINQLDKLNSVSSSSNAEENQGNVSIEQKRIYDSFKGQYYLAGSVWDGQEQAQRFFEQNIWENGHEEKYVNAVNAANPGDIILLKATFYANEVSYLRIKGVGRITSNPLNGTDLEVDWKLKNIQVDIEDLGKYRRTFARVMPDDLELILNEIGKDKILDSDLFGSTVPIPEQAIQKLDKPTIAGLVSDSDTGEDYLEIQRDINAFSKIMSARSFSPPLAIALFGKWGTGKSFFMMKLRAQIQQLSELETDTYCKGVAQIHFNAWSYLDANLWASLVSRIFEGLNDYISENAVSEEKEAVKRKLTGELTIAKEEVNILQKKKDAVDSQITSLEKQKGKLSSDIEKKIGEIRLNSLKTLVETVNKEFNVHDKISEAIQSNPQLALTEGQLKEMVPEKYWEDPTKAYEVLNSKYSFVKEFFRLDKVWGNLLFLAFAGLAIWKIPAVVTSITDYFKNFNWLILQVIVAILTSTATIWERVERAYKELQPVLASLWSVKEQYNKEMKNALDTKEQGEKALKLEIEKGKAEIIAISTQIQNATVIKADLEYRINNALATEALYSFIERRNVSDDYKKHLGIVSIIRKDFEILSSLFVDHGHELNSDSAEFRKKFKRPLERIVLYIDDLDRCPEDRVVEVLEAVHLLMAFPLFIVVVGVDQRWVKNALMKHYRLQFAAQIDEMHTIKEIERIEASNYLEKIFQVPFHLKEASNDSVKHMLRVLSEPNPMVKAFVPTSGGLSLTFGRNYAFIAPSEPLGINLSAANIESSPFVGKLGGPESDSSKHITEPTYLIVTEMEIALMEGLSKVIGNNPRGIKRFVNIYQIVKAHEDLIYEKTHEESELLVIMFLLALSIGPFKKLYPIFEKFLNGYNNQTKLLSDFLAPINVIRNEELHQSKHQLDYVMTDSKEFNILRREAISSFKYHNQFIQRFTFEDTLV